VTDAAQAGGSRLAAARAARGLAPAQVAQQLRITPEMVLAMEEGRYADLGPAVFARGHLRKYAALLGVPAEEVLADYDASPARAGESTLIPPASAHTPVGRRGGPRMTRAAGLVAGIALLVVLAGAGWWYWQSRVVPDASPAVPAAEVDPAGPEAAVPEEAYPEGGMPAVTTAGGRLVLEFEGPCWLEVYDAEGRRLAFELAEPGAAFAFDGPAPWRVVLGNADTARLTLDGNVLDIPASMRVREAALVTIADDGTVAPAPGDGGGQ
jgi:cytoskeleton protein RodZ